MPIEMYGESRFMHFWVDILTVLYIFGCGTARLGEWRLNHIHSINGAEVINASVSDSSAEIDYRHICTNSCTRRCNVFEIASHIPRILYICKLCTCPHSISPLQLSPSGPHSDAV